MADLTRKQLVVGSLFYPAFLSNMTYLAADKLFDAPAFYDWATALIVVALLLHFVADWLYTMTDVDPKNGYAWLQFTSDLVIVLCLYFALRFIFFPKPLLTDAWPGWLREPVFWLLLTKLLAVAWEVSDVERLNPAQWSRIKRLALALDGGFALAYAVLLSEVFGLQRNGMWFGVLALADAGGYWLYSHHKRRWHDKEGDAGAAAAPLRKRAPPAAPALPLVDTPAQPAVAPAATPAASPAPAVTAPPVATIPITDAAALKPNDSSA